MQHKHLISLLAIGFLLCSSWASLQAATITGTSNEQPASLSFQPSASAMEDISAMLEKAKNTGKLGMVVMGANWCHDSQAFLRHLQSAEMQPVLAAHYDYILVDVGLLDKGREVINRFGMPVIYGTPTVLVIDPNSGFPLNRKSMHRWRDAYKISAAETARHFTEIAGRHRIPLTSQGRKHKKIQAALKEIDTFEIQQAERIYAGFALVGPMIGLPRRERLENFDSLWQELRDFRYRITADLAFLREQANETATEPGYKLELPLYPAFSWEK